MLQAFGFQAKGSKGSHHTFANRQGEVLTIPKKGGQKVKRVYIKRVLDLLDLEEWQKNCEGEE